MFSLNFLAPSHTFVYSTGGVKGVLLCQHCAVLRCWKNGKRLWSSTSMALRLYPNQGGKKLYSCDFFFIPSNFSIIIQHVSSCTKCPVVGLFVCVFACSLVRSIVLNVSFWWRTISAYHNSNTLSLADLLSDAKKNNYVTIRWGHHLLQLHFLRVLSVITSEALLLVQHM